jgi:hypothetical protein
MAFVKWEMRITGKQRAGHHWKGFNSAKIGLQALDPDKLWP